MVTANFPQRPLSNSEKLMLLHRRMGHINMRKLIDGYVRMRFTGYTIPRELLGQRALVAQPKCDSCGMCKQRRRNFHKAGEEERPELYPGHTMCVDIHVFVNCMAHDGTLYRANFTDPQSTRTLSYDMVAKDQLIACCQLVKEEYHAGYNLGAWRVLRCDQEGALSSAAALS